MKVIINTKQVYLIEVFLMVTSKITSYADS